MKMAFFGRITGIRDHVGFHGTSVAELRGAFQEAEADYLETCVRLDRVPQKPYWGNR
jgi:predicted HicB family RNase H-like nuclease